MEKALIEFNSAEVVGHNEDLLTEILLYLRIRCLMKFKIVSKQWLSIISSSRFSQAHARSLHSKGFLKPSALFINATHYPPWDCRLLPLTDDCVGLPRLDFIDDVPHFEILQSCNGLLLCGSGESPDQRRYFICNPTSRKFKVLSIPTSRDDDDFLHTVNLVFDPLKSPHYKIVSFWLSSKLLRQRQFFIDIYSSETNSWILLKDKFIRQSGVRFDRPVFFKGALHWDTVFDTSQYFDIENERLHTIPMPRFMKAGQQRYFGESGGYLNLVIGQKHCILKYSVYEMKEDRSGWYLKYCLDLKPQMKELSKLPFWSSYYPDGPYQIFFANQFEEEGDSIILVSEDGNAMSYNFKDRATKSLHCTGPTLVVEPCDHEGDPIPECPCCRHVSDWFRACPYIESTLSCIL